MTLDKEHNCPGCDPEYFYLYGICPCCNRKCAAPLFDPDGDMTIQEYLKFAAEWNASRSDLMKDT